MKSLMCKISFLIVILLRLHVKCNFRCDLRKSSLFNEEEKNNNDVANAFSCYLNTGNLGFSNWRKAHHHTREKKTYRKFQPEKSI
jgi:hypothetical protein